MHGQDLDKISERLSPDELEAIVGSDIVANLKLFSGDFDMLSALKKIAVSRISDSPTLFFSDSCIRKIIYDNMSGEKIDELINRLQLESRAALYSLSPKDETDKWHLFTGFFGLDVRNAAPITPEPDVAVCHANFGLFDHQRVAANEVLEKLDGCRGRVILHMPTGAGKTRTAMHIACDILKAYEPCVIVWLAASSELLEQASEAFEKAWSTLGNRDVAIFRSWGDHQTDISKIEDGIVIAGFQKLFSMGNKAPQELLRLGNKTKLTIVDEAHQAIADTYSSTIEKISNTGQSNALLGLTATPGRTWADISEDQRLSNFFDNNKVVLVKEGYDNVVDYLMDEGYLARPSFNRIDYEHDEKITTKLEDMVAKNRPDYPTEILDQLAIDANRNSSIVSEVIRLISDGHTKILFFAASVRNAEILAAILNALSIYSDIVTGETPKTKRCRIIRDFKKQSTKPMVLCNYGVLTTGFDAPSTSSVIIARPTRSLVLYSQMVGRATRGAKAGGNETAEVSTVVDINLPGFGNVTEAFTNWEDVWN